ncbi:hypothetical protein N7457_001790 [Penicillium paradoxum]|uniref:uncharacterized protein n=1 Tax=Penicillium paradoxum TaxID=176176 RepID=UPI00254983EE|nr:uncharacterized protein N7457_001790 [Penicillium paradoxum]KAJ5795191.1 hypothetical protein N7457_001790 [Penicillium paradoxum]
MEEHTPSSDAYGFSGGSSGGSFQVDATDPANEPINSNATAETGTSLLPYQVHENPESHTENNSGSAPRSDVQLESATRMSAEAFHNPIQPEGSSTELAMSSEISPSLPGTSRADDNAYAMASRAPLRSISSNPGPPDHLLPFRPPLPYPLPPLEGGSSSEANPYIPSSAPRRVPGAPVLYSPERMIQAWIVRQQLIVGIRPENLQPVATPRSLQHRTPPWIMLSANGAQIMRLEPARFRGTMLPMPSYPWIRRSVPPESHITPLQDTPTAPVSSNEPDTSQLPATLSSPVASNPPAAPPSAATPDSAATLSPGEGGPPLGASLGNPDESAAQGTVQDQTSDPRVTAFLQPLRLHNADDSNEPGPVPPPSPASNSGNPLDDPSASLVESEITGPRMNDLVQALRLMNPDDSDSMASEREASSTSSSESEDDGENPNVSAPGTPHANGAVPLAITWPGDEDDEDPDEQPAPGRFPIDG